MAPTNPDIKYDWHPAAYSKPIMEEFQQIVDRFRKECKPRGVITVLDPFAGTGRIHRLTGCATVGVEIQPQWAALHHQTLHGDATNLPADWSNTYDILMTSPTYGNRFADKHDARDGSKRRSYTHDLRRMIQERGGNADQVHLEPNNTGGYGFQTPKYKQLHEAAWREAWRVLKPGGWFVLNVSDYIARKEVVEVCEWHHTYCAGLGFNTLDIIPIATQRLSFGRNGQARVANEMIFVMEKKK